MYKNSKFTILLPTVIACSLAAGMLLGSFLLRSGADRPARRAALSVAGTDKLNMLLRLIDAQYVDTVRMDSLTEEIIPLILENLDPHSMYFSAKDLAQANETIEGEFDGIGVVFNMATDTVIVLNVIAGGPSRRFSAAGNNATSHAYVTPDILLLQVSSTSGATRAACSNRPSRSRTSSCPPTR